MGCQLPTYAVAKIYVTMEHLLTIAINTIKLL